MGFIKKIWKDRISEFPTRRSLTKTDGTSELVTVARSEGMISEEGDAFSAENMNDFENRVANGFSELTEKLPNPVLLWENPDPTQRFPVNGTIELSSNDYNWLEIYYTSSTTSSVHSYQKVKKGNSVNLVHVHYTSSGIGFGNRTLTYVDDTHLKSSDVSIRGYFSGSTFKSDTAATAYAIPVKIYGIK